MAVEVYYDGGCPVCSREIAFYRTRPGTETVQWVDVTAADATRLGPDLTRDAALARMHVRDADGRLHSGAAAFGALWRQMPGMRWLGALVAIPPIGLVAEAAYRVFLRVRKIWR